MESKMCRAGASRSKTLSPRWRTCARTKTSLSSTRSTPISARASSDQLLDTASIADLFGALVKRHGVGCDSGNFVRRKLDKCAGGRLLAAVHEQNEVVAADQVLVLVHEGDKIRVMHFFFARVL